MIPRRQFLSAIGILLTTFLTPARATTLYVDATIGKDYADGLSATLANGHGPKLDTYSAIAAAQNGDTIIIATGTYEEPPWNPGTNNLTLRPADGVNVIPLTPEQLAATSTNAWAHGLTRQQVFDNPTVLVADGCCSLGDGIADWWKVKHGFGLNDPTVARSDPDHDGFTNLQEFHFDTDPTDPDSFPSNLPPSLVAWWKLDEGASTNAFDYSGNDLGGVLQGDPLPAWISGVNSNALAFDGVQNVVTVADNVILTPTNAFTVMAWVRSPTTNLLSGDVAAKWAADYSGGSYWLSMNSGQVSLTAGLAEGGYAGVTGVSAVTDTNWHHVAGVYDGTQMVVCLDGVADGALEASGPVLTFNGPLLIGNLAWSVDDLRLYRRALGTNEIAAIHNYSTIDDGIPDWWKVKYGFSLTDTGVATADPDQDDIINLYEYQYGTDPLTPDYFWVELNAGLPATTNNFVNVDATFYQYPLLSVSLDSAMSNATLYANSGTLTFNLPSLGSTNYPVYFQFAAPNTNILGHVFEQDVIVDKDPPILTLDPGQGQTNDLSNPLLVVQYSDAQSGLDIASLVIKIDDVDVTASFYVFAAGAVADGSALAAGTHTWSAGIADLAGNVTVTNAVFVSTGTANPSAPTLSNLNLTDSVTLMPDLPEIWVQGKVSGEGSAVYASVNGGEVVPMNRRDDDFGRLLPLEYGTNVIVLSAADQAGTNLRSRVLLVERSDRFQATITSPAFGTFANGQQQTICGVVSSKYDDDTASGLGLAGLALNDVAIALNSLTDNGDGTKTFCATVPGTNCSVMALVMTMCWTNVNGQYVIPGVGVVTNNCPHIPLGLLEGYEIVNREEHTWGQIAPQAPGQSGILLKGINPAPPASPCPGMWSPTWMYVPLYVSPWGRMDYHNDFGSPCDTPGSNSTWYATYERPQTNCVAGFGETNISWEAWPPEYITWPTNGLDRLAQPDRGLGFGSWSQAQQQLEDWSNPPDYAEDDIWAFTSWWHGDGTMTVRWPLYYDTGNTVLLTFEGVGHSGEASNVLYLGQSPLVVTNGAFSYTATVSDDHKFNLNASSFSWDASSTNYVMSDWYDAGICWMKITYQSDEDYFGFTGFHNQVARPSSSKFWAQYTPVNYVTIPPEQNQKVWELVAGNIGEEHGSPPLAQADNACATRLSYALNRSGYLIPSVSQVSNRNWPNLSYSLNHKKGDGFRYIISAAKLDAHLKSAKPPDKPWGSPDFPAVATVAQLDNIVSNLKPGQCAIFATPSPPQGYGHSGVLKSGYQDPFVKVELPVDVWLLPVP